MSARRHRTGGLVAATLSVSLVLAGCTGHHAHRTAATPTRHSDHAAAHHLQRAGPQARGRSRECRSPVAPVSKNPVVAVKIDDTPPRRPQRGSTRPTWSTSSRSRGGCARLLAVFHTRLPVVEAVRSARANDPELLAPVRRDRLRRVGRRGQLAERAAHVGAAGQHRRLERSGSVPGLEPADPLQPRGRPDRGGPRRQGRTGPQYRLHVHPAAAAFLASASRTRTTSAPRSVVPRCASTTRPASTVTYESWAGRRCTPPTARSCRRRT